MAEIDRDAYDAALTDARLKLPVERAMKLGINWRPELHPRGPLGRFIPRTDVPDLDETATLAEKVKAIPADDPPILKGVKQTAIMMENAGQRKLPEWHYNSPNDFLIKEGTVYDAPSKLLPDKYRDARGVKKECFQNAFELAQAHPELTYVEGVADSGFGLPLEHAWCVDEAGRVVDPTWDDATAYLGVPIPQGLATRMLLDRGLWGLFVDWENNYPHLRQPWSKSLQDGRLAD